MLNRFALGLSIIFHPILATTYIFIVIFSSDSFVAFLPLRYKITLTTFVALNTIFLPLLLLVITRRLGVIKDYLFANHRERVFPLIISTLPFLFTIFLFTRLQVPFILIKILQAGIYALLSSAAISFFWKISLHLTGMGGVAGFLFSSALQGNQPALYLFAVSILLSGMLASARLIKGDHNPLQVYSGFLTGFAIATLVFSR